MKDAPDILAKIAAYKRGEVAALKAETSIGALREKSQGCPPPRGFTKAIRAAAKSGPALITEVKKASPSKGLIRADFNPADIAKAYEQGGAACLSVLTDGPGFQGSNAIFSAVRAVTALPLLRKDFMIDPIQIAESRALGADAILVILSMVDDKLADALMQEAVDLGMEALVETHNIDEVNRAKALGASLIGINNRNLRTFKTSLDTFRTLAQRVDNGAVLIAESGIFTPDHITTLTEHGADGFLIGESLMRQENVMRATQFLRGLVPGPHL